MSEVKHTPLPWSYQEDSDAYTHIVRGPKGEHIVQLSQDSSGVSEATARLIVCCVNSHEELVEALTNLTTLISNCVNLYDSDVCRRLMESTSYKNSIAALAKAGRP